MWPFATSRSSAPSLSRSANAVPHDSGLKVSGAHAARLRDVLEHPAAEPVIERREVFGEVRGEEVGDPVAVHVAHREAHARLRGSVLVERGSRPGGDLLEDAAALVPVEVVRVGVVGDVDVDAAVAGEVGGAHAEAEARRLVLHPRRERGVDEALAAVVAEEVIGRALEAERPERHRLEAAPGERGPRGQHLLDRDVDVGRDVEVEPAVAVGVEERSTGVPARRLDADLLRHVLEAAVAEVAIEDVPAEGRDEDVGPAVVVVVGDGHALRPTALRRRRRPRRSRPRSVPSALPW